MKLNVFVQGRPVATLTSLDGFIHELAYLPHVAKEDFISLLMPVQPEPWTWPALHPFFQVNLPEGFLLSVLKEQLGPHLGASPLDLLSVVGRNSIGRVQVTAGHNVIFPENAFEVGPLLHGENSADVFMNLLHHYTTSGVSGVAPKFLTPETHSLFHKSTLMMGRYLVKSSSPRLPFLSLNEHLCMEVARRTGFDTSNTQVSEDGQVLVVERFDMEPATNQRWGFEDICSLLGLSPEDKYQSTWERVARLASQWVPEQGLRHAQEQLAVTLLLTYALGNADCHTKNLGLLYSSFEEVHVAPIYDMPSIRVYDAYANNPPGLYINGKKTWKPGKALWRFIQQHLGIEPARQRELVDIVCGATASVFPELMHHVKHMPGFSEIGSRMIWEWNEGLTRLADRLTFAIPDFRKQAESEGIAKPNLPDKLKPQRMGESSLLGRRH